MSQTKGRVRLGKVPVVYPPERGKILSSIEKR
jgi:hypothetical protein